MFYPMAKAVTARLGELPKGTGPNDAKYIWLMFPIIVTSGDLLVIDSAEPNPTPEPRDWVGFSRELKSGRLSGTYALDFVRRDQLEKFVNECIGPLGELAKELVETKADFLLQPRCVWQG
jgi:hypothetical protein